MPRTHREEGDEDSGVPMAGACGWGLPDNAHDQDPGIHWLHSLRMCGREQMRKRNNLISVILISRLFFASLDPVGKLASLFADVDESRPGVQPTKRVSTVVLLDLTRAVHKPGLALPFNLSGPDVPLDRTQLGRTQHQSEADDQRRYHGLDANVDRERVRGEMLRQCVLREGCRERRMLLCRVATCSIVSMRSSRMGRRCGLTRGRAGRGPSSLRIAKSKSLR